MVGAGKRCMLVLVLCSFLTNGCQDDGEPEKVNDKVNEQDILNLIDLYVQAVNTADADLLESLFWKDDPRFTEVENHIPTPFGARTFSDISDWIRKNGTPGNNQQFYETAVHILSPEVAYSVSMRNEYDKSVTSSSRVSLVYLKKDSQWKIIHGHFSYVPG